MLVSHTREVNVQNGHGPREKSSCRPSEDIVPLLREIHDGIHNSAKQLRKHKKKDGSLIEVEVTRCETIFNGCVADIVTAVDVTGHILLQRAHAS
jgi:hypothetical protein